MLAALVIALLAALPFAPQLHEGDTIPPIALADQDGRAFDLAGLHGRSVVLSFIYTRCTDSCALVAAKLAEMAIGIFVGESMGYRTTGLIDAGRLAAMNPTRRLPERVLEKLRT